MSDPSIQVVPLDQAATPDPQNVNLHTQRGAGLVENSLRKRGAFRSLAAAGKGVSTPVVYAGNLTLEKAHDAGFTEAIVVHSDGTRPIIHVRDDIEPGTPQAVALGLEDNESAKQSYNPDIDLLATMVVGEEALLAQLSRDDITFGNMLAGMGIGKKISDAKPKADETAAMQAKWQVKVGDVWQIGDHKLICGDATNPFHVDQLMGKELADLVFTDPPYGVSYIGENNPNGKQWDMLENDDLRGDALQAFLTVCFRHMEAVTKPDTALYTWHASSTQREYQTALEMAGYEIKQQLIWNKGMVLGHSDYHWAHEPVFYCKKAGGATPWYGDRANKTILGERRTVLDKMTKETLIKLVMTALDTSTVWEIDRDSVIQYQHSTQKPTRLALQAIENSSTEGQSVVDFFAGSGSTMVACENSHRICRSMEIKPEFCAVILERMEQAFPLLEPERK